MRISGTEPSSVILGQTKQFKKLKGYAPKVSNQIEAKWNGVINPQNYNFSQFYTENFDALKPYESTEVECRTWLHVPSGTPWSPAVTLTK